MSTADGGRAQLVTLLNAYFDAMVAPIRAEGGVVDKFVGDAIMAIFGGVLPLERPSEAAVRAARGMAAALDDLNARWAEEGMPALRAGIGVHAGAVVLGSIVRQRRSEGLHGHR